MTDQHRATPEQWEVVEICREEGRIPWPTATALLELRARVEALEAAPQDKLDRLIAQDRAASAEARPGGLVERVAESIAHEGCKAYVAVYGKEARAAIREVAAAAKDLRFTTAKALIDWLDREADRG
jgi:L-lactate utilization protein LutB